MSPLIQNFTVMTSSKWKMNATSLKEDCLSYNIFKSGRKSVKKNWDTLKSILKHFRHRLKSNFLTSDDDMMMSQCIVSLNEAWNHLYNSCPIQTWKKNWGLTDILKSYGDLKITLFLPIFAPNYEFTRARIFMFNAHAWRHNMSKKTENFWICLETYQNSDPCKKNELFSLRTCCVRPWRARGRARTENFEMLKMTWFVLSFAQNVILTI